MKLRYDREEDILMIETLPDEIIDHAEQVGSFIAHFSAEDRMVLLEVLDASDFLSWVIKATLRQDSEEVPLPAK